ncbi:hypothetical protein ACWF0M_01325 [Kribbella sp. NPDC055110]
MTTAPLPPAERPTFFAGQLLTADDLNVAQAVDTEMRWLHHRILHGWGIASGLVVTGRHGEVAVDLGAGYALDLAGRELVVDEPVQVPVPPVANGPDGRPLPFALVVRWRDDEEAVVVDRAGPCGAEGAVLRSDAPIIAWIEPEAIRQGIDVVLAEILVQGCRLSAPPDPTVRRQLRPPPTPYIACGATPAHAGWFVRSADDGRPWAVCTDVDTSEAGFGDVPAYLARLVGTRLLDAANAPHGMPVLVDGAGYIEAAEVGRFRFVVPLPGGSSIGEDGGGIEVNPEDLVSDGGFADLISGTLGWGVEWIGVQS